MKYKNMLFFAGISLCSLSASGASVSFTDHYLRSWNGIISHTVGEPYSNFEVYTSNTGSSGPIIESNSTSYASAYGSSDILSLSGTSQVDATNISALGFDYAVAEATMRYEATMNVSSESGFVDVSFDVFFNKEESADVGASTYGEQRLRIFEDGELIVAYLHGLSSLSSLQDIRLSSDKSYEIHLSSTAHTKADAGFYALNSRDFSASVSSVSEVPIPASLYLFSSSLISFFALRSKKRLTRPSTMALLRRARTSALRAPARVGGVKCL